MELLVWGANSYRQLGVPQCEQIINPQSCILPFQGSIKAIAGGSNFTLFLTTNGNVYECGFNYLDKTEQHLNFYPVLEKIVQIACGWDFRFALSETGNVFTWGSNTYGQLGIPKTKFIYSPTLLQGLSAKSISCGLRHAAIITENNQVLVCGNGSKGQLGLVYCQNNKICQTLQDIIPNLNNIISIACGQYHTLALDSEGHIYGWGYNKHGQLGFDPKLFPEITKPAILDFPLNAHEIHAGWTHSAILTQNGEIYNVGRNTYGQLGADRVESNWKPMKLDIPQVKQLSLGSEHNLALTMDGKVFVWGWNEHGNCGTGDVQDVKIPKQILNNYKIDYVSAGTGQSLAIGQKFKL